VAVSHVAADPDLDGLQRDVALAVSAYDAFAPFYDVLTKDADYDWWWSALLPLAEAAGVTGRRVLDVACGTGKSLEPLLAAGWSGVGVDASSGMLELARAKLGQEVPLLEHDMRDLPALGEFDLICALNDSINYLLDEQELIDTFRGFRRNLAPGGVVVFDVNTIGMYRNYEVLVQQEPGRVLVVEGNGRPDFEQGALMRADFTVLEQRNGFFWTRRSSPHFQRHHPDADLRRAMDAAGLELFGTYGQTGKTITDTLDELNDEKAVYVARVPHADDLGEESSERQMRIEMLDDKVVPAASPTKLS
jgi:SAM-dependent methyltransferase